MMNKLPSNERPSITSSYQKFSHPINHPWTTNQPSIPQQNQPTKIETTQPISQSTIYLKPNMDYSTVPNQTLWNGDYPRPSVFIQHDLIILHSSFLWAPKTRSNGSTSSDKFGNQICSVCETNVESIKIQCKIQQGRLGIWVLNTSYAQRQICESISVLLLHLLLQDHCSIILYQRAVLLHTYHTFS